jgi:hypothetical protein
MDPLRLIAGEQPDARHVVVRRLAEASSGGFRFNVSGVQDQGLNARAFSGDNTGCAKYGTCKTPDAIVKKK